MLAGWAEVSLSKYVVVGKYIRHDTRSRHALKDRKQGIVLALESPREHPQKFLLWAPPGSGKTFFLRKIARSLPRSATYRELNLGGMTEPDLAASIERMSATNDSALCLIDEIDTHPAEGWPFERLLPLLEGPGIPTQGAFVLAGSSPSASPR